MEGGVRGWINVYIAVENLKRIAVYALGVARLLETNKS